MTETSKKIPIFCSLIPTEIVVNAGFEPHYINPSELQNPALVHHTCSLHDNICSYSKTLYQYFLEHHDSFHLIIIPAGCDALKRLYNALKGQVPDNKLYFLDFPKIKTNKSKDFLSSEFKKLNERLEQTNHDSSTGKTNHGNDSTA